jgi:hypothetical protein
MRTRGSLRRIVAGLAFAAMLSVLAGLVPPAIGPAFLGSPLAALAPAAALAADDLGVTTKTRYVVRPDSGLVHATVDVTVLNQKPNRTTSGVITRYFYNAVNLGVQLEATHVKASQGAKNLHVTAANHKTFRLVTVNLGSDLYFGQTTHVRIQFDLPAGNPRSGSDVRVGPAFATFLAWAFGDKGSVRIDVPAAFAVDVSGETMTKSTAADGSQEYTASTNDAIGWYAWVNARNDNGLTRDRLDLPDGERIVVRGWPEDSKWRRRVSTVLSESVPKLVGRIGLPWPVDGPLNVLEVHTPLLEGYAGFYDPKRDEITISENLDDVTIIHEASHAWFNDSLFADRWINEGLAEEYAARVFASENQGTVKAPTVKPTAKAAFPLGAWPAPAPIKDAQSDAREQYGYDASWTVIRRLVAEIGEPGMRNVFKAADHHDIAYPGDGTPETSQRPNDWRRFLDLVQAQGGAPDAAALLRTWVVPAGQQSQLVARDQARAAYATLLAASDGWAAPVVVRTALDGWSFDEADARMDDAQAIVTQRDTTAALAHANGLTLPDDLETSYESAGSSAALAATAALATNTQSSLSSVIAASTAVAAPRDWLTNLGLGGKDPDGEVTAARSAWEMGDLATASDQAALASATIGVAAEAGRGRAILVGGGIVLVVVLALAVLIVVVRRLRRRGRSLPPDAPTGEAAAPG